MIIESTIFQSPMRWPSREPGSTCGARLMLSWPPAITISASPSRIACAASITAFRPEPQTLLIVSAGTLCGRPALMTVWRAGFWPEPAVSTWPRITSPIWSPLSFARSQQVGDDRGAEFGRGSLGQRAAELAHGGAGGGDDHDVGGHGVLPGLS